MSRVIVTGGAGFIGSHLAERLCADGHRVTAVDSLVVGRRDNLLSLENEPRFDFVQADVASIKEADAIFREIDWVFHLAARADIVPSIEEPRAYYEANVTGTFNVLEAARRAGVKRFLYAASSSCYGIPEIYPTPESVSADAQYPYAQTKYLGEELCLHWRKLYRMPVVSLRLFNVYGPRHRTTGAYGAMFGVFLAQILAGKPLTIVGDGTQTRDFTFVTDVVDAFVTAAQAEGAEGVFNVGSGDTVSVNRVVELLGGGEATHIPSRPGEPRCTFADISRIRAEMGWAPKVSMEEGVRELLANIEYWRDAPVWTPESIAVATQDWFRYLDR